MKNIALMSLALVLMSGCATENETPVAAEKPAASPPVTAKNTPPPTPGSAAELRALIADCDKDYKTPFRVRVEKVWALLQQPAFATNVVRSLPGYDAIAKWSVMPTWTQVTRWDRALGDEYFPKFMPCVLESMEVPFASKPSFARRYAIQLCGQERYDEAIAMVRRCDETCSTQRKGKGGPFELQHLLFDIYLWADRFDDALKQARFLVKSQPNQGAADGLRLAEAWNRKDLEKEFMSAFTPEGFNDYWHCVNRPAPGTVKDRVAAYVQDTKNPPLKRLAAFERVLPFDMTERGRKCVTALKAIPDKEFEKARIGTIYTVNHCFLNGNWRRAADWYELMLKCKSMEKTCKGVKIRRVYAVSLANAGDRKAGAAFCDKCLAEGGISESDTLRYRYLAAMMRGESVEGLLEGAKIDEKEKTLVLRSAGRQAQAMELAEVAQELAAEYASHFTKKPERTLAVTFSENPIRSVADWRKIRTTLQTGICDLPFGASVEALITDVNTQRTIAEKGAHDNLLARMEITSVCDRYALHVFLRVADPGARKVEHGFASGIPAEVYFAPGDGAPYQCLLTEPLKGVTTVMNTLYNSLGVRRLVKGEGFRSEIDFTDADYVIHIVFDWAKFFDRLPTDGRTYKFECLSWGAAGGRTWAGSRGIHHSSDWGRLVFNLTDAQLTEIRREIVLANYRGWRVRGVPGTEARGVDLFEKWADEEIGDPAYYAKHLASLQREMDDAVARVKPEMDDATVNEIYEKALPFWMETGHHIDASRKAYLGDLLTEER